MDSTNKKLSLLEKMKLKTKQQKVYGGEYVSKNANLISVTCTNCGAPRSQQDGLTHCAYCGFEFITTELTDGITIKKEDNSKK